MFEIVDSKFLYSIKKNKNKSCNKLRLFKKSERNNLIFKCNFWPGNGYTVVHKNHTSLNTLFGIKRFFKFDFIKIVWNPILDRNDYIKIYLNWVENKKIYSQYICSTKIGSYFTLKISNTLSNKTEASINNISISINYLFPKVAYFLYPSISNNIKADDLIIVYMEPLKIISEDI